MTVNLFLYINYMAAKCISKAKFHSNLQILRPNCLDTSTAMLNQAKQVELYIILNCHNADLSSMAIQNCVTQEGIIALTLNYMLLITGLEVAGRGSFLRPRANIFLYGPTKTVNNVFIFLL